MQRGWNRGETTLLYHPMADKSTRAEVEEDSGTLLPIQPLKQLQHGKRDLRGGALVSEPGGKQDDLRALRWKLTHARGLAQDPLAPVSEYSVAQTSRCDEGDSSQAAFVAPKYRHANELMAKPSPMGEDLLKFKSGFDGLHGQLDSELLATLGATTCENGAAALGCHAGAEAMGLCALPLVGLIRTLHLQTLLGLPL